MTKIIAFFSSTFGWVVGAISAVLAVFLAGRHSGKSSAENALRKDALAAIDKANKVIAKNKKKTIKQIRANLSKEARDK
jgi:hypothetical protein